MHNEPPAASLPDNNAIEASESSGDFAAVLRIKNEVAIRLLQEWMADESGYDETAWETVKKLIEENKLSNRGKFDE